jgi:hypothetical protein
MTNYYCTPDQVRKKLGFSSDEVSDEDIIPYIVEAQKAMVIDLSYNINDEMLYAVTSTTFTTSHSFIADIDFDKVVTTKDIIVCGWGNRNDPDTKVTLSVSKVFPNYGRIVLASPSTFDIVTADYNYYSDRINENLIPDACAYLAAYGYALQEVLLMPAQWMHGAYRFMKTGDVGNLEKEYWKKIYAIKIRVHEKDTADDPSLDRGAD